MSTRAARIGAVGAARRIFSAITSTLNLANLYKASQQVDSYLSANPDLAGIANYPQAKWINNQSDANNIPNLVTAAAGKTLLLTIYAIPGRDSGNYSAGGFPDRASYISFITSIKTNLNGAPAVIFFEPDALGLSNSMAVSTKAERIETLRQAISVLATAANVETYIDASMWISTTDQATLLQSVDVAKVAGILVNTSGYNDVATCQTYGDNVTNELTTRGVIGKKYVVDTSRAGAGSLTDADRPLASPWLDTSQAWCNPPKRRLGPTPQIVINASHPNCRAFFWVKSPGESDGSFPTTAQSGYYGENAPSAGTFWLVNAKMLLGTEPAGSSNVAKFGSIVNDFSTALGAFTNVTSGVTLVSGRARINAGTGYDNMSTPDNYTLASSSIYAQIFPPSNTGATSNANVQFTISSSSAAAGTRLIASIDTKAGDLYIGKDVGYYDANGVHVAYNSTSMAWLRWREASGTVYLDTSPDKSTWTNRFSSATPSYVTATTTNKVQFVAYKDAGTGYAEIDNINA